MVKSIWQYHKKKTSKNVKMICPCCHTPTSIAKYVNTNNYGAKGCKVDWCMNLCNNFINENGEWDSTAAHQKQIDLACSDISDEEKMMIIAAAAGRCTYKSYWKK